MSGAEISAYLLMAGGLAWILVGIVGLSRRPRAVAVSVPLGGHQSDPLPEEYDEYHPETSSAGYDGNP
jgi:hypothetical protein